MRTILSGALAICFLAGGAAAAPGDGWAMRDVGSAGPLREAVTGGTVHVGEAARPSTLTVGCRADNDGAVMTARFVVTDTLDFPFVDFEGPGGAGEGGDLLSVSLGDAEARDYKVSGWHAEAGRFTFSFLLPQDEAARWREAAGRTLSITVRPDGGGDAAPLRAAFPLPVRATVLGTAIEPCLKADIVNR